MERSGDSDSDVKSGRSCYEAGGKANGRTTVRDRYEWIDAVGQGS